MGLIHERSHSSATDIVGSVRSCCFTWAFVLWKDMLISVTSHVLHVPLRYHRDPHRLYHSLRWVQLKLSGVRVYQQSVTLTHLWKSWLIPTIVWEPARDLMLEEKSRCNRLNKVVSISGAFMLVADLLTPCSWVLRWKRVRGNLYPIA